MPIDSEQINKRLLPLLYREILLDHRSICDFFDEHNIAYAHPKIAVRPSQATLNQGANWLIQRAARRAIVIGATGGSIGYAGVPFEQASYGIHIFRLGQRLVALYGQDPQTAQSEQLILQGLAQIFHFELDAPRLPQELVQLKSFLSHIKNTAEQSPPSTARFLFKTVGRYLFSRHFKRLVPTIGLTLGAIESNRALYNHGQQLHEFIASRLAPTFQSQSSELAFEIPRT